MTYYDPDADTELIALRAAMRETDGDAVPEPTQEDLDEASRRAQQVFANAADQAPATLLLASDGFTASELRSQGVDPDGPNVIRLDNGQDGYHVPGFQLQDGQSFHPVVLRINEMLGAYNDPWGVADWWLGPNVWLRGVPADLIGQIEDQKLVDAAEAAING